MVMALDGIELSRQLDPQGSPKDERVQLLELAFDDQIAMVQQESICLGQDRMGLDTDQEECIKVHLVGECLHRLRTQLDLPAEFAVSGLQKHRESCIGFFLANNIRQNAIERLLGQ
jgi:hypothetical protein